MAKEVYPLLSPDISIAVAILSSLLLIISTLVVIELQVVVNTSNTTTFTAGERIVLTCDLDTGGAPPTDVMWM